MYVDQDIISQLAKQLDALIPDPKNIDNFFDFYHSHAIRWMMKRSQIEPHWTTTDGEIKVHTFVDPSGVGKSSLVYKIAEEEALKNKKSANYKIR